MLYPAENQSSTSEYGRWDGPLHPKKGRRSSTAIFSDVFIHALHLVSNVGILPVSLIAFKAFAMANIALSASFLKKDSINKITCQTLVMDLMGRPLMKLENPTGVINISQIPIGTYFIDIEFTNSSECYRIINNMKKTILLFVATIVLYAACEKKDDPKGINSFGAGYIKYEATIDHDFESALDSLLKVKKSIVTTSAELR